MNLKNVIIALLVLFMASACSDKDKKQEQTSEEKNKTEIKKEKIYPKPLTLTLLNDKKINLEVREGGIDIKNNKKANLFVFFATWCPPCKAEIPHLNNISQKHIKDLNIIGVLLEEKDKKSVQEFADKFKIKYDIAIGESNYLFENALGGIRGIPFSILYKPNGDYAKSYTGLVPEEMLESDINKVVQ